MFRIADSIDNEACMYLSDAIWQETCALFNHDPERRQPDWCVKVPRFGCALLPVQAHAVWHALQQIQSLLLSIILTHVMGIGKTTIALCIAHVQHEINRMHTEIRAFPDQHCPPGTTDRTMVCPFRETMFTKWGFHCPCAPTSPTYFVKERLGVPVCLSPTGLLDV